MNSTPSSSYTVILDDMRTHNILAQGTTTWNTDVPKALGGLGVYPSPAAILSASLASCMLSMIAFTGKRKGFETNGISITAAYQEDNRGIQAIHIHITVPIPSSAEIRALLETCVRTCPVSRALHPDIRKIISWTYADLP